jgi:lysophospholipase L1-like esterase
MTRRAVLSRMLAPVTRFWLLQQQTKNQSAPRPRDAPEASAVGPDPVCVLIFGSGPAVGWAVLTHAIALPGSLARALTLRTGRGTKVELVADMRITVSNAGSMLRKTDTSRFDAVVIVLGTNDAIRLMPLAVWRARLLAVLNSLDQTSGRPQTFVTGIPPVQTIPGYTSRLGRFISVHAVQMNDATARLCEAANVTYVPLPSVEPTNALGVRDGRTYRKWADTIADVVAPQLDNSRRKTPRKLGLTPPAFSTPGWR